MNDFTVWTRFQKPGLDGEDIDRALLGLGVLDGEPDPSPETTALIARLDRELAQHESEQNT